MSTERVFHYFIDDMSNNMEPLTTACGLTTWKFETELAGFHTVESQYLSLDGTITCKRCRKTNRYKTDAFNHLLGVDNV